MLKVISNSNNKQKPQQIKTIYPSSSANNAYESKSIKNNLMLNSHYGGNSNNNNFLSKDNESKGNIRKIHMK